MNEKNIIYGWHFAANNKRLGHGDNRLIEVGITHWIPDRTKEIELAVYGLHASTMPLDALRYASGSILSYCRMHGKIIYGMDNNMVAEGREYLAVFDADTLLWKFARWYILQLLLIYPWKTSKNVKQYLLTGDTSLREALDWEVDWKTSWNMAYWAADWTRSVKRISWEEQNMELIELLITEIFKN